MEFAPTVAMVGLINIALILTFTGLGIYTLIFLIKALKIHIKKNS